VWDNRHNSYGTLVFKGHPVVSKRFEEFERFVYFLYFGFLRDGFGMPSRRFRDVCKDFGAQKTVTL
ncbi:MAG: hypothetical protein PUC35_09945, partial [Prevotellaceae bacterium]|nr:hypothetical protein [Prevotellaceae bacterium]